MSPIRLSEILTYAECPEKYRRSQDETLPASRQMIGGSTIAMMVELYLSGADNIPSDIDEFARICMEAVLQSEPGRVRLSPEDLGVIVDRSAAIFHYFRPWWDTQGIEILGVEVEIRSHHKIERGGRVDFIVKLRDGKIGIIDGKAHGVYGKSINSQSSIPDLSREIQTGWYGAMFQHGCIMFAGVPNSLRHASTQNLALLYHATDIKFRPDLYGIIEYGHLLPFERDGKSVRKGERRGDVLFVAPFHGHLVKNADDLASWFVRASAWDDYPRIRRYAGMGKFNCDTCVFAKKCWPDSTSPEPMQEVPGWIRDLS